MEFHGGGETTREDRVIYGDTTGAMIDEAVDKMMILTTSWESDHSRGEVRTIIEQVVWKVLREVEDNGPW